MLVILADGHTLEGEHYKLEEKFFAEKKIEFRVENCVTENDVIEKCKNADAVLSVYAPITEEVIDKLDNCKALVRYGIGFDNIDIKGATKHGIPVCNIPDYSIPEVATHTLAMLLQFERKLNILDTSVKQGEWNPNYGFKSTRLSSLTLGLVGFGNIAQQVSEYAKAFGMNIITYDPFISDEILNEKGAERVEIEKLFEKSDYVSLHVPLNDDTHHLINSESMSKMKNSAVLLNTARGPIIEQSALVEALKNGEIRGACLDVLENEPAKKGDEILELNNVLITPHAAFNSKQASERLHTRVAETTFDLLSGEVPTNVLNKEIFKG